MKQQKPVDEKYLDEAGHTGRGNEDEVLHKFVWSMYKFVLSAVYFYYSSVCKGMPFIEQSYISFLSRRCSNAPVSL